MIARPSRALIQLAVLAVLLPAVARAQSSAPGDSSLFAAREAAWRDWFAGSPGLDAALPADFISISPGDTLWHDRAYTISGSRGSAAGGTRLRELRFPRNVVQRLGNVAVVHSRYEAVLDGPQGVVTLNGLITEVFVWDGRRWMHPSWHMTSFP